MTRGMGYTNIVVTSLWVWLQGLCESAAGWCGVVLNVAPQTISS